MWFIIVSLALVYLMRATRRMNRLTESSSPDLTKWQRGKHTTSSIAEELIAQLNDRCRTLRGNPAHYWMDKSMDSEEVLLTGSRRRLHII